MFVYRVWYVVFSFDQVYIKHACDSISMTTWGRVYYTNLMAAVPLLFAMFANGEHEMLQTYVWTTPAFVSYLLSCAIGTGIAYFAFLARAAISATAFTVVSLGNVPHHLLGGHNAGLSLLGWKYVQSANRTTKCADVVSADAVAS